MKRQRTPIRVAFSAILMGLLAFGCTPETVDTPHAPRIESFTASPSRVAVGGEARLAWAVTGDIQRVELTSGARVLLENARQEGEYEFTDAKLGRTPFTLTAYGRDGSTARAQLDVTAVSTPDIRAFTADRTEAPAGAPVVLVWDALLADDAVLFANEEELGRFTGDKALHGRLTVRPVRDTTYRLKATGLAGEANATLDVRVNAAPVFTSVEATPERILAGDSTTLSWTTERAETLTLKQGARTLDVIEGEEVANGSRTLTLDASQDFTLVATGPGGTEHATLSVSVVRRASVEQFVATPSELVLGAWVTLSWRAADADVLRLFANGEEVELDSSGLPEGSATLQPTETTRYSLQVEGEGGGSAAELTVRVHGVPVIDTFDATPRTAFLRRDPVVLSWTTTGASSVSVSTSTDEIIDLEGQPAAQGSVELFPDSDTTYTLVAHGPGGVAQSMPLAVTVREPPPLIVLSLLRDPINRGMTSELAWHITDADAFTVEASTDGGATFEQVDTTGKTLIDAIPTTPLGVTLYRVRATNEYGDSEQLITQRVVNPPAVTRFDVPNVPGSGTNAVHVTMDSPFTVEWETTDADGVLFDPPSEFVAETKPFVSIVDRDGTEDLPVPTSTSGYQVVEFPAGFRYPFFGVDYTTVRMAVPGYLCFGDACGSSASTIGQDIPSTSTPNGVIAPFWSSLKTVPGQTRWLMRIDGLAPFRKVTLEWSGMDFSSTSYDGENLAFQVVLHESGLWELHNAPRVPGTKNASKDYRWGTYATIGVESPDGASALAISYRTANGLCSSFKGGSGSSAGSCDPITSHRPALEPAVGSRTMTLTPPNYTNNSRTLYLRAFGPLGSVKSQDIVASVNRKPTNVTLTASKTHVGAGEKVTFNWTGTMNPAMDFAGVRLIDGDGALLPLPNPNQITGTSFSSSFDYTPTKTTTYRLVAYNKAGASVESAPVEVVFGVPVLTGVKAAPTAGARRDPYAISWSKLTGAKTIRLVGPDGNVVFTQAAPAGVTGSLTRTDLVLPGAYELIASNDSGDSLPGRFTLDIATDVRILAFSASDEEQTTGKPVTLSWEAYNGTSLTIYANGEKLHETTTLSDIRGPSTLTRTMGPTDTTYVLSITDGAQTDTREATVRAAPTPQVTELLTEPSTPDWNEPFKLKWKTRNATNVRVQRILSADGPNQNGAPTPQVAVVDDYPLTEAEFAEGEITLRIDREATYRVVAENRVGDVAEGRITKNPRRQSPSLSFDVTPASGTPSGGYSELSWSASQVDGVKLFVPASGARLQVPFEYVPYGFVDISGTGTELPLALSTGVVNDVAGYATVPFPDAFRPLYFGEAMAGMLVSARGILTLSPNPNNLEGNGCVNPVPSGMPTSFGCPGTSLTPGKTDELPNSFLAPFHGTLSGCYQHTSATTATTSACVNRVGGAPDEAGKVFFELRGKAPDRVAIVQWNNWDFASASYKGTLTFQAKIYENGDTEFQYKRLYSTNAQRAGGDQGILGIESPNGKQFVWLDERTSNDPLVFDGDGYRFYTGLQPLERTTSQPLRSRFIVESGATSVVYRASVQTPASNPPSVEKTHAILPGDFAFNELMIDPGTAPELGNEWIEIRNQGARANLKGYTLTTASSFMTPFTFTEDLWVERNAVVLLAQSASPGGTGTVAREAVYGESVRLNNVQDTVILRYGDVLIDQVQYDRTGGWSIPRGRSLMLDPRATRTPHRSLPELWCPGRRDATGSIAGSPGFANDACLEWVATLGDYDPDADIEGREGAAEAIKGYSATLTSQKYDVPLGFDFPYFGEHYSTVNVAALGFVAFGDFYASTTSIGTPMTTTTFPTGLTYGGANMIAPLYAALGTLTTGKPTAVYTMTQGDAPNRRFVVHWANYRMSSGTSFPVDFSLILTEQGDIEFHYKTLTPSTGAVVVGMQAFGNEIGFPAFKGAMNGTNSTDTDLKQLPPSGSSIRLLRR